MGFYLFLSKSMFYPKSFIKWYNGENALGILSLGSPQEDPRRYPWCTSWSALYGMPPKSLAGRPPDSGIHKTYFDRDGSSQNNNPIYHCKGCNEKVYGKDPSKLFIHACTCPNSTEDVQADVREAFKAYQAKKESKKLLAMGREASTSDSGASVGSKKRKEIGTLDRHIDTKVRHLIFKTFEAL